MLDWANDVRKTFKTTANLLDTRDVELMLKDLSVKQITELADLHISPERDYSSRIAYVLCRKAQGIIARRRMSWCDATDDLSVGEIPVIVRFLARFSVHFGVEMVPTPEELVSPRRELTPTPRGGRSFVRFLDQSAFRAENVDFSAHEARVNGRFPQQSPQIEAYRSPPRGDSDERITFVRDEMILHPYSFNDSLFAQMAGITPPNRERGSQIVQGDEPISSSGSLLLDNALGGGFVPGRLVGLNGAESNVDRVLRERRENEAQRAGFQQYTRTGRSQSRPT
jgi:hypothetical protein